MWHEPEVIGLIVAEGYARGLSPEQIHRQILETGIDPELADYCLSVLESVLFRIMLSRQEATRNMGREYTLTDMQHVPDREFNLVFGIHSALAEKLNAPPPILILPMDPNTPFIRRHAPLIDLALPVLAFVSLILLIAITLYKE